MVIDVHGPGAQCLAQVINEARALTLFQIMRVARGGADTAIHNALEPGLGIVLHDGASNIEIEQRCDVRAVRLLETICDPFVQPAYERFAEISVVILVTSGRLDRRDIEQEEVVVVGMADGEPRCTKRRLRQDSC